MLLVIGGGGVGGGGGRGEQLTCPYSMKVQARPPRDQGLVFWFRVSGQEELLIVKSSP